MFGITLHSMALLMKHTPFGTDEYMPGTPDCPQDVSARLAEMIPT